MDFSFARLSSTIHTIDSIQGIAARMSIAACLRTLFGLGDGPALTSPLFLTRNVVSKLILHCYRKAQVRLREDGNVHCEGDAA